MDIPGYGFPPGIGEEGLGMTQARMPRAPMPSGPPQVRNSRPPPPPAMPPTPPGIYSPQHAEAMANAQEMLAVVSQRVAPMLAAAARHSETQVSTELRKLDAVFKSLREKAARVEALISARDKNARPLPKDGIAKLLTDLEQRWDQEIKAVKRELHQTILAHNHNADLMADHKTAIDKIRLELDERGPPARLEDPALAETLARLGSTLEKNRASDQDIDMLLQRGEVLFQRIGASMSTQPMSAIGGAPVATSPYPAGQGFQQGYPPAVL